MSGAHIYIGRARGRTALLEHLTLAAPCGFSPHAYGLRSARGSSLSWQMGQVTRAGMPTSLYRCCTTAVSRGLQAPRQCRVRIRIWLPLVDALRTLLLVPSPEVREILDHRRAHRHLGA